MEAFNVNVDMVPGQGIFNIKHCSAKANLSDKHECSVLQINWMIIFSNRRVNKREIDVQNQRIEYKTHFSNERFRRFECNQINVCC